jgi:acetyl esterase
MGRSEDEGVLDPWVAEWLKQNPQPDWMTEGFPPEILPLARGPIGPVQGPHVDQVTDEVVSGVPVRIYRGDGPQNGLVVYFHGGAFVIGSIGIMDNVARELANSANVVVVSVEYKLAPENPYPAGLDDCESVTRWALDNASRFDLEPSQVYVCGESAGGTLATAVALRLRDAGDRSVAGQVLIYPCTDGAGVDYPSREQFGRADWVWSEYGGARDLGGDPYAIPMHAETLKALPPALVVLAGCDALRDEGRAYAGRMRDSGVEVDEVCYPGQPHGFINFDYPAATSAWEKIGDWLRAHLSGHTISGNRD